MSEWVSDWVSEGGGGPTTKKIMPPGKTQDVLCLFCSFLFFFKTCSKSTFLCRIWSKMCPQKRTKKIMMFVFLIFSVLFCSFFRINKMSSNREQKTSRRRENRKMSFVFFVVGPPK